MSRFDGGPERLRDRPQYHVLRVGMAAAQLARGSSSHTQITVEEIRGNAGAVLLRDLLGATAAIRLGG